MPIIPKLRESTETKDNYDRGVDWHIQKSLSYNWSKQINRFIHALPGNKILDVGCGGGRDITKFLKNGFTVEGLDYSFETIKKCVDMFVCSKEYVKSL